MKQYKTYVKVAQESDFLLAKPSGMAQQEEDDKLVVEAEELVMKQKEVIFHMRWSKTIQSKEQSIESVSFPRLKSGIDRHMRASRLNGLLNWVCGHLLQDVLVVNELYCDVLVGCILKNKIIT